MVKKSLVTCVAFALMAVPSLMAQTPQVPNKGFIAQTEIPVCIIIDKYTQISVDRDCLELHEISESWWWMGSCMVTVVNNWSVKVTATIEPYEPSISNNKPFQVIIEGSGDTRAIVSPFNTTSTINLNPYPEGYTFRVWAAIEGPKLLARASSAGPQRVATIYLTVQN